MEITVFVSRAQKRATATSFQQTRANALFFVFFLFPSRTVKRLITIAIFAPCNFSARSLRSNKSYPGYSRVFTCSLHFSPVKSRRVKEKSQFPWDNFTSPVNAAQRWSNFQTLTMHAGDALSILLHARLSG